MNACVRNSRSSIVCNFLFMFSVLYFVSLVCFYASLFELLGVGASCISLSLPPFVDAFILVIGSLRVLGLVFMLRHDIYFPKTV